MQMIKGICFAALTICSCVELMGQSNEDLFLQAARKRLKSSKEYTLKVAALMPEGNYSFKPTDGEMSFGQQLLHLAQNLGWLSSSYLVEENNPVNKTDMKLQQKDSIVAVVTKSYDYAIRAMDQLDADRLKDTVPFFAGPMNKLQIINLINDHQTHHRGQILVYLRLKDISPPDYVGW